jgi:hypothetical protein
MIEVQRRLYGLPPVEMRTTGRRGGSESGLFYACYDPRAKRVKLGQTSKATTDQRLAAFRTSAPEYTELARVECKNPAQLEARVMDMLGCLRTHPQHEVFEVSPANVKAMFQEIQVYVEGPGRNGEYAGLRFSRALICALFAA